MSIHEVDILDRPVCPGCKQADKVEAVGTALNRDPKKDWPSCQALDRWWCDRCNAILSALPALPAQSADRRKPEEILADPASGKPDPKRPGRKRQKRPPDPENPIEGIFEDVARRRGEDEQE